MSKNPDREFDKSHLSIDRAMLTGFIHKDYIAHCQRWSYTYKFLKRTIPEWGPGAAYKHANVLDVGCGVDVPMYKVLCSNRLGQAKHYTGVDINKLEMPELFANRKLPYTLLGETDILSVTDVRPNLIVSFEMMEHVRFDYCQKVAKHLYDISTDDAYYIVSTPVFDPQIGMADNHINEMTREVFRGVLEDGGWTIVENMGTFGSIKDYYKNMTGEHQRVHDELAKYHTTEMLTTMFVCLYPQFARNNIWVCKKG